MRSTIAILTVLSALTIGAVPLARAQYSISSTGAGQPAGYYVPVITTEYDAVPANYSAHLSDDPLQGPVVSSDYGAGCSCGACDQRGCDQRVGCDRRAARGCPQNCNCLSCRHEEVFSRAFGSLEYLHWYNKGISLPPLVTSNNGIPAQADAGVIGGPTTTVLFGNEDIDDQLQAGARLTFGMWLDDCCNLALAAKVYGVEGGAVSFFAASAGDPVLARPFFNSDVPVSAEDALLVAFPGITAGNVTIAAENDVLGFELFGRSLLDVSDTYRIDLIGGYQFNRIDSSLAMSSVHNTGAADFFFNDLFDVQNRYHAGALGIYGESYHDVWTFSAMGKIALGNMQQSVNIQGNNTIVAGGAVTTDGGLYAQPTNIGLYDRDVLTWAPEANFKLSCAITQRLSVSVGYSFLYFTRVAFAGDQIDRNVNATQLNGGPVVGPARPAFAFRDTDFWVQTVDIGLAWNY